jgi:hypothetical protein
MSARESAFGSDAAATPFSYAMTGGIAFHFIDYVPLCAPAAIVERESDGNPNAIGADGGFGLCQITAGFFAFCAYNPGLHHPAVAASHALVLAAR